MGHTHGLSLSTNLIAQRFEKSAPSQSQGSDDSFWSASSVSQTPKRTRSVLGLGQYGDRENSISGGQSRLDKTTNTLRRVCRRASHSVSQITNHQRPRSRASNLLRRATSFCGRPLSSRGQDEKLAVADAQIQPLSRRAIHAAGGDAARAAAAAQNQLRSLSQCRDTKSGDVDAESGIGIEASATSSGTRLCEAYKSNLVRSGKLSRWGL